jgi:hypothetical protein
MGNYLLCCAEIILFYLFVERESNLLCRVFIYFCLCPGRLFGLSVLVADLIFAILGLLMLSFPGI